MELGKGRGAVEILGVGALASSSGIECGVEGLMGLSAWPGWGESRAKVEGMGGCGMGRVGAA